MSNKFHDDIFLWSTINNVISRKDLAEKIYSALEGKTWTIYDIERLEMVYYYG